jgi:hypothetical protein
MNTTTTMNTGAASLSDERERAAITACALMIKGICLTRPNAEWTGAIEDRIQFMLKQMQAGAAIAAGGAQEAVATVTKTGRVVDFDVQIGAFNLADGKHSLYAAPLPREAATVPATDEQKELEVALAKVDPRPYCPAAYTEHVWFKRGWKFRALLAASGDQS